MDTYEYENYTTEDWMTLKLYLNFLTYKNYDILMSNDNVKKMLDINTNSQCKQLLLLNPDCDIKLIQSTVLADLFLLYIMVSVLIE